MQAPIIETDRLILRAITLADWPAYCDAWSDPRMTIYIGGEPRTAAVSWPKFCQAAGLWPLMGYGYWTFTDRQTGAFLGNGGLARFERGIPDLSGYPEAGWAFVPDAWGRGLATEAVHGFLGWADREGIPEVRCIIAPENAASIRVAEKAGFNQKGIVESDLGVSLLLSRSRR